MLYVRHTVGSRLFYETNDYEIVQQEEKWEISFRTDLETANTILKFKEELNIFHVQNDHEKTWYYSSKGNVIYQNDEKIMTIIADNQMIYPV